MKQELMGMDEGSAAFKKLSAEAGALEDRIEMLTQESKP